MWLATVCTHCLNHFISSTGLDMLLLEEWGGQGNGIQHNKTKKAHHARDVGCVCGAPGVSCPPL